MHRQQASMSQVLGCKLEVRDSASERTALTDSDVRLEVVEKVKWWL
jgi:hypothetical protein